MLRKISSKQGLIIILNGTSCAGKSTLTTHLISQLDSTWQQIACDVIEDQLKKSGIAIFEPEKQARALAISEAKNIASQGKNVIVDIPIFEEKELASLSNENVLRVLVYAPPATLVERDIARTLDNKNPLDVQAAKRAFIITSFCNLYQPADAKESAFDSFNPTECKWEIEGLTESYYLDECIQSFKEKFASKMNLSIQPCFKHDVIINTTKLASEQYIPSLLSKITKIIGKPSSLDRVIHQRLPDLARQTILASEGKMTLFAKTTGGALEFFKAKPLKGKGILFFKYKHPTPVSITPSSSTSNSFTPAKHPVTALY